MFSLLIKNKIRLDKRRKNEPKDGWYLFLHKLAPSCLFRAYPLFKHETLIYIHFHQKQPSVGANAEEWMLGAAIGAILGAVIGATVRVTDSNDGGAIVGVWETLLVLR